MKSEIPRISTIGYNIRRMRKLRGFSQMELAEAMGISRQNVGKLEQLELIEEEKLNQVAKALGVTAEAIETLSDEAPIIQIQNMYDNAQAIYHFNNYQNDKIEELYNALLKAEKEKNDLLQHMLNLKDNLPSKA